MALKPCKECGKEISTTAKTCPHCGAPTPLGSLDALGGGLSSCGCLMTLLITIPMLLFLFFLIS